MYAHTSDVVFLLNPMKMKMGMIKANVYVFYIFKKLMHCKCYGFILSNDMPH